MGAAFARPTKRAADATALAKDSAPRRALPSPLPPPPVRRRPLPEPEPPPPTEARALTERVEEVRAAPARRAPERPTGVKDIV